MCIIMKIFLIEYIFKVDGYTIKCSFKAVRSDTMPSSTFGQVHPSSITIKIEEVTVNLSIKIACQFAFLEVWSCSWMWHKNLEVHPHLRIQSKSNLFQLLSPSRWFEDLTRPENATCHWIWNFYNFEASSRVQIK